MSKEIKMLKERIVIVDDEDYECLMKWKWYYSNGYAKRKQYDDELKRKVSVSMHRQLSNCPVGLVVDHIDRNKLNNQNSNLRICEQRNNTHNRDSTKGSASEYKGVSWKNNIGMWSVAIANEGKNNYIGIFTNEIAAANAYNFYVKIFHGDFGHTNNCPFMEKDDWITYKRTQKESEFRSKYVGVSFHKKKKKWVARIGFNGKRINVGEYILENDAAMAYNLKSSELFGEKAKLNIIGGE